MTCGVYFVATSEKYLDEVIANVVLSRQYFEGLKIAVCTDLTKMAQNSNLFDFVFPHPSPVYSYRDKIHGLQLLPFSNTLFLDTDAKPCAPIITWLSSLPIFHLAASYAPVHFPPGWRDLAVPNIFPEVNSGVLFLKRTPIVLRFLNDWLIKYDSLYNELAQSWDQASLRSVLWNYITHHHLFFHLLPSEYNLRTTKPWILARGSEAKIIHGRFSHKEWKPFVEYLNHDIDKFREFSDWNYNYPDSDIRPRFDRTYS